MQLAPKPAVLREIKSNDGHWAVHDHLMSPILVLIESPRVTSSTYILPVSHRFRVIAASWSNYRF